MNDSKQQEDQPASRNNWLKRNWYASLWPQWPLAIALAFVGFLSVLDGLSVPVGILEHVRAFTGMANSLSALGHTAQVILGLMLIMAGMGLLLRLVSAWTLSVFLLVITVGVNVAQELWGLSLALQAILLGALLWTRRYFTRRTILASFLFSLGGIVAILAYGTIGSYLLRDDFHPKIGDWSTAFYYTIVTLSTVGYGDIVPVSETARWFAMSLLIVGLGVFASAIASALGPKISGELQRMFNPKEKTMEPKDRSCVVSLLIIAASKFSAIVSRIVD